MCYKMKISKLKIGILFFILSILLIETISLAISNNQEEIINKTNTETESKAYIVDEKEPKLQEIQFYSKFYITKDGIATEDEITVDWVDNDLYNEITPEKVDKKCQKIALRIKTLAERAKLKRITSDF